MYRYICMGIARLGQKFDQNARALLSTNQIGKVTLEGSIKARGHKKKAVLTSRVSILKREEFFSPFLGVRIRRSRFKISILLEISDSSVCNLSA